MLERAMLLSKLETVAPALADNDLVPLFTHFVFTGSTLMAYCERLAISVPLKTDFKGAVPGKIMLDMLRASGAKNVDLQDASGWLRIKAAGANIRLPMMPADGTFKMPAPAQSINDLAAEPSNFFAAVDDCLQSVAPYATQPDLLGITMIPTNGRASLFSSNNSTLSHSTFKLKYKMKNRVILSADFCRQVLRMQKDAEKTALEIRDGYAMFSAGSSQLYGTLVNTNNPLNYDQIIQRVHVAHSDKSLCEKPKGLARVLDRAVLITDIAGRDVSTKITLEKGKARFESESERGKVVDVLPLPHPNISVSMKPSLWRGGYDRYEKFRITDRAVVMTHENGLFAITVS